MVKKIVAGVVLIGRLFFKFHVGDIPSDSSHTGSSLDRKARAFPKQHIQRRRTGKLNVEPRKKRGCGKLDYSEKLRNWAINKHMERVFE